MANCAFQTYYCSQTPIEVGDYLYADTNYTPVSAGYYSENIGVQANVYKTDGTGKVIEILNSSNTECSNQITNTYEFWRARAYDCLTYTPSTEDSYVVFTNPFNINGGGYYKQTSGTAPDFVYKLEESVSDYPTGVTPILLDESTFRSTADRCCSPLS